MPQVPSSLTYPSIKKCFQLLDNFQLLVTSFAPCLIVEGMPKFKHLFCYENGDELHGPLDVHLYI